MDKGHSHGHVARELEREQEEILGAVVYSAQALRRRHQEIKLPGNGPKWATPTPETCAVSDLEGLVTQGRSFSL